VESAESQAKLLFEEALLAIHKTDFEAASLRLFEAEKLVGPRKSIFKNQIVCLINLKQLDQARDYAQALRAIDQTDHSHHLFTAQIAWKEQAYMEALNSLEWMHENDLELESSQKLFKNFIKQNFTGREAFIRSDQLFQKSINAGKQRDVMAAEEWLREALAVESDRAIYWESLAIISAQKFENEEAKNCLQRAKNLRPLTIPAEIQRLKLESTDGQTVRATMGYAALIDSFPCDPRPVIAMADHLTTKGNPNESVALVEGFVRTSGESVPLMGAKLRALFALGRYDEVLKSQQIGSGYSVDPSITELRVAAMIELGLESKALAELDRALLEFPGDPALLAKQADIHKICGDYKMARQAYETSLARAPYEPIARNNYALLLLSDKDYTNGWAHYHSRWKNSAFKTKRYSGNLPQWTGVGMSSHLLVWAEQGLGDEVFYSRFLGQLRDRVSGEIYCLVDPRLTEVFSRSFERIIFKSKLDKGTLERCEFQISMAELARIFFETDKKYSKVSDPYLRAQRQDFTTKTRKSAGVSWKSLVDRVGRSKSIGIKELKILSSLPVDLYSIQYGDTSSDLRSVNNENANPIMNIEGLDVKEDIHSLASTVLSFDFVITISNVNAHLAGALGVRVYMLVPFSSGRMWYWHRSESISSWYPTIRMYNQDSNGSWDNAVFTLLEDVRRYEELG
jgi:tetratricopeptide (TPR) repeat protein